MMVMVIAKVLFVSAVIASFCAWANAQAPNELISDARKFVEAHESRLGNSPTVRERYHLLLELAPAAYTAEHTEKAERFARELIETGAELGRTSRFDFGEPSYATHIGHTILGLIKIDKGEIASAREHLIASASFEGDANAVLKSFGPNMSLADLLIRHGERQTVLRYFELCSKFWRHDTGKLESWRGDLTAGKEPDFRESLHTSLLNWRYSRRN